MNQEEEKYIRKCYLCKSDNLVNTGWCLVNRDCDRCKYWYKNKEKEEKQKEEKK